MAIDIFDPIELQEAVRVMPHKASFLKDTLFNSDKLHATTEVMVDFKKGQRRVATFVSDNAVAPVTGKIGYATNTFETPLVSPKDVTTILDTMKRVPGEVLMNSGMTPEGRARELLLDALTDFETQIILREEVMCAQALFTGKIPVIGEGVNRTITFSGFTHNGSASTLWDASGSTADPIEDLKVWVSACQKDGSRTPTICVFSPNAYAAFVARCMAIGYFDQANYLNVAINPSFKAENVSYCGYLKDPALELYVYNDWYQDDWTTPGTVTTLPIIPKGKLLLASQNCHFPTHYGVLAYADEASGELRSVMAKRLADSWMQKEPAARFLKLMSRPLPCPIEVDSWYAATVAATT